MKLIAILLLLSVPFVLADSSVMIVKVRYPESSYENPNLYLVANETMMIDAENETQVLLSITTSANISNAFIQIGYFSNNTEGPVPDNVTSLNKFITLQASTNLKENMDNAIVRMYYTDADLVNAGIASERNLGIYYWNSTKGWVTCTEAGHCVTYGRNTDANYLWVQLTSFSTYGIFETVEEEGPSADAPQEGGGGGAASGGGGGAPAAEPSTEPVSEEPAAEPPEPEAKPEPEGAQEPVPESASPEPAVDIPKPDFVTGMVVTATEGKKGFVLLGILTVVGAIVLFLVMPSSDPHVREYQLIKRKISKELRTLRFKK